jgi:hypothetical protein
MVASSGLYNNTTSPFNKPWDLSQKANQERWLVASKAASDHVCFDISVITAKAFSELLKDKSEYYCWGPFITLPTNGDGLFDGAKAKLANGEVAMKIEFGTKVHLLTQWTKVSTSECQQFVQWFNGDDSVFLSSPFEIDPMKCKVVALNCNEDNNKGLVCRNKVQLRIIDQLILHILKNHLTTSTYKSVLTHKNEFSFLDEKTGNKIHSELVLMRKMLDVCEPMTIVEVCHLKKELNTVVLWPIHENNIHLLTTPMMTLLQEIHAKTGKHLYTDQHFLTNLFCTLELSPTNKFLSFVDQLKSQWIMEDITLPSNIIQKLDKMHRNMVVNSFWLITNEKDTKIVALTSAIQEGKKKYGELAKKVYLIVVPRVAPLARKAVLPLLLESSRPKPVALNGKLPRKATTLITRAANKSGAPSIPPRMAVSMVFTCPTRLQPSKSARK